VPSRADIEVALDTTLGRHCVTGEPRVVTDHRLASEVHRPAREHPVVAHRAIDGNRFSRSPDVSADAAIERHRSSGAHHVAFYGAVDSDFCSGSGNAWPARLLFLWRT
jgi:hypothetical protein